MSKETDDKNEKRVVREAHHMKDISFDDGFLSYKVSNRKVKSGYYFGDK